MSLIRRLIVILAAIGLVFGSLLSFPSILPYMIGIWALGAVLAIAYQRMAWPWLLAGAIILATKRPGFALEFWLVMLGFLGIAWTDYRLRGRAPAATSKNYRVWTSFILMFVVVQYGVMRWHAARSGRPQVLDDRPIVCLGDSLTDFGYPQSLEQLVVVPVVDFGRDGINTDAGIKLIPDILAHRPQAVVIELGGHDYNSDRKTRAELRKNLVILIETFQQQQAAVVLVEIPRGFISDPYDGLERELAAVYDLELVDDSVIRNFIFNSPILPPGSWRDSSQHFSDDGLHPNSRGNRYFARIVSRHIENILGPDVRRPHTPN